MTSDPAAVLLAISEAKIALRMANGGLHGDGLSRLSS